MRIGTLSTMALVRGHRSGTPSPAAHGPPPKSLLRPAKMLLIAFGPATAKSLPHSRTASSARLGGFALLGPAVGQR
jgi:hypothetical protein